MADTTPYSVPQEPGRWTAIALAVAVHAALFAFLWIGIRWQSETPVAIEAEVWDMQTKEAAPKEVAPPPVPQPEPEPVIPPPQPKPEVKTPVENPDIALELEKKKKEKAKREEEERLARLKEEKARAEKEKQAKLEKERKEQLEKEKLELAKKEKEKQLALEKEKAELAKKEKAEAEKKRLAEQEAKLLAQLRKDTQKNIAGTAGSGGSGTAEKSQGMRGDPSYAAKVAAKIKANTYFGVPSDLQGNPAVEYDVQLFPDGSLRGAPRKVKSSGIPAFDEAVRRAIETSAPYPADKSGAVPSGFQVIQRPKEQ